MILPLRLRKVVVEKPESTGHVAASDRMSKCKLDRLLFGEGVADKVGRSNSSAELQNGFEDWSDRRRRTGLGR